MIPLPSRSRFTVYLCVRHKQLLPFRGTKLKDLESELIWGRDQLVGLFQSAECSN